MGQFLWSYWQQILGFGSLLTLVIMAALFFAAKPAFDAIVGFFAPILTASGGFIGRTIDSLEKTATRVILIAIAGMFITYNVGWYAGQEDLWQDIRAHYRLLKK